MKRNQKKNTRTNVKGKMPLISCQLVTSHTTVRTAWAVPTPRFVTIVEEYYKMFLLQIMSGVNWAVSTSHHQLEVVLMLIFSS